MVVVVFPTPPFWLVTARMRALTRQTSLDVRLAIHWPYNLNHVLILSLTGVEA